MKIKGAKNTESPVTVNSNTLPLQSPVTRNKVRSFQVNSVSAPVSSVSAQTSCESRKIQYSQENSMIAKASYVPPQTAYDSNKIRNIRETSMSSKATSVPSQSTCDSSMMLREDEQPTVITKAPKLICQNGKFEEQNLIGNVAQNARGQNKAYTSKQCDAAPPQTLQKPRERRTYSSVRSETGSIIAFQDLSPKLSPAMRYADHRETQNHCVETKIADLRKGLQMKPRTEVETADVGSRVFQQPMKNGSEIEYQNKPRPMFISVPNSELTHQEHVQMAQVKEPEDLSQVDRNMREGSTNSDLRPTPAKEAEQMPPLDLLSCKTNGVATVGTHVSTLAGNSLTIKSGNKEVVVVFMNPPQYFNARGGQTTESDRSSTFQEREIPATLKSAPAVATASTNIVNDQVLHSDKPEMPLQSTCHTTVNEANISNQNISCDTTPTIKVRDVKTDTVNDDSYRHSFQRVQRPVPIIPHESRSLLSFTLTEPPTNMTGDATGVAVEQSTFSSNENVVDNKRNLVPIREDSTQVFSSNFDGRDPYNGNTGNLVPVREASAQSFPRNFCGSDVYSRNSSYQNNELQMQIPSSLPSSAYREDDSNARTWLYENPAAYQYGRDQISSHEDPVSEAHYQTQVPVMGQHSIYGSLSSYGQHTIPNVYRDDFIDMTPDATCHVRREPIGVLRCRRFGSNYGGHYVYPLPPRNVVRSRRTPFLDRRPHIYHRRVYPEQPLYGYVNDENLFFLNRY